MKVQIAPLPATHAQLPGNGAAAPQEDDHRHHSIGVMELANVQTIRSQLADGKTDRVRLLAKQAFSKPVKIVGSHKRPRNNGAA